MNINTLQIINTLYALIKINKQDINKCNILLTTNLNIDKNDIYSLVKQDVDEINKNLPLKDKISEKLILSAFNFEIFNNLSLVNLKKYSKLGNYDIGVSLQKQNNNFKVFLSSGNGYMLSKQKKNELLVAVKEFQTLTSKQINMFFKSECKKQTIKPLSANIIKLRLKNHL